MKAKEVVDELTVKRAITRITYEIIERNKDLNKIILAGIKRVVFSSLIVSKNAWSSWKTSLFLLWNWTPSLSVMMLKAEKILL